MLLDPTKKFRITLLPEIVTDRHHDATTHSESGPQLEQTQLEGSVIMITVGTAFKQIAAVRWYYPIEHTHRQLEGIVLLVHTDTS